MDRIAVEESDVPGLLLIRPHLHQDDRGWFARTYSADVYEAMGSPSPLIQENQSRSRRGTIRGLHFRMDLTETKFVRVVQGRIFDVVVDLRPWSAAFLQIRTFELAADEPFHLRVPPGCAHGFQALSDSADVFYGVDARYEPDLDGALSPFDPQLSIAWPLADPILSERDRSAPSLASIRSDLDRWFAEPRPA